MHNNEEGELYLIRSKYSPIRTMHLVVGCKIEQCKGAEYVTAG